MEDKGAAGKPLRTTTNKLKDLYNTYMKNEDKNVPVNFVENDKKAEQENADSPETTNPEIISEMEERITLLEKERDDLKEQLLRKVAEMENYHRRTLREKSEMIDYANERLLKSLLPILDDLSAAVDHGKKSDDYNALLTGVDMIFQKTLRLFEEAGVKPMDNPVGSQFDVDFHEALMHIPNDMDEGLVIQEVKPGFMLKSKVLRHSQVITSAGPAETQTGADE